MILLEKRKVPTTELQCTRMENLHQKRIGRILNCNDFMKKWMDVFLFISKTFGFFAADSFRQRRINVLSRINNIIIIKVKPSRYLLYERKNNDKQNCV